MFFFGINVNIITQKLKSKHLVCLSFLWWEVFLREREKIFFTYFGPIWHSEVECYLLGIDILVGLCLHNQIFGAFGIAIKDTGI